MFGIFKKDPIIKAVDELDKMMGIFDQSVGLSIALGTPDQPNNDCNFAILFGFVDAISQLNDLPKSKSAEVLIKYLSKFGNAGKDFERAIKISQDARYFDLIVHAGRAIFATTKNNWQPSDMMKLAHEYLTYKA